VDPVTVSITIDRPIDEVFDFLADISNHATFCDHFLVDWRLTRLDPYGEGAGARFQIKAPFNRFSWSDMTLVDVRRPYRIAAAGRGGKFNRVRLYEQWTLEPAHGGTRVELMVERENKLSTDRIAEIFGGAGFFKRNGRKALGRLKGILEDGRPGGPRVTVGGV
jgi:uncharacterized protein YndB with AHSA1/START domain